MASPLPLRGITVLVVEDDHTTLKAFSQVIAQVFGCTVVSASSWEAALRVIASGEKIDLLFSDVIMSENGRLNIGAPRTRPIARASHHPHHGVYDQIESVIAMGVIPLLKPFTREQLEAVFAEQLSVLPPLQPALHKPYSTI